MLIYQNFYELLLLRVTLLPPFVPTLYMTYKFQINIFHVDNIIFKQMYFKKFYSVTGSSYTVRNIWPSRSFRSEFWINPSLLHLQLEAANTPALLGSYLHIFGYLKHECSAN